jgi:putative transposase
VQQLLENLAKKRTASSYLVERSQMLLLLLDGALNSPTARKFDLHVDTVRAWRKRWLEAEPTLAKLETQTRTQAATDPNINLEQVMAAYLEKLLTDLPRPGTPATFTPEQVALIVAVACEDPALHNLPLSQWTNSEIAREVVRRGIVPKISPRSIARFFV